MRGLGRDRRLPGSGRSADEEQQRLVDALQRVDPPQPPYGARRLLLADELGRELAQAVEVERRRAALAEVAVREAGDEVRALGVEPRHDERASHETLRERNLVAEGKREAMTAFPHDPNLAMPSSSSSSSCSPGRGTTSFAARTTSAPRASAASATTSIAAAFSSTR